MFWRRKKKKLDLSCVAYARYLRAQRPHWAEDGYDFFRLSEDEQEALAQVGDQYAIDCCDMGIAVSTQDKEPVDPKELIRNTIVEGVQKAVATARGPQERAQAPSMSGLSNGSFLGRKADRTTTGPGPDLNRTETGPGQ